MTGNLQLKLSRVPEFPGYESGQRVDDLTCADDLTGGRGDLTVVFDLTGGVDPAGRAYLTGELDGVGLDWWDLWNLH